MGIVVYSLLWVRQDFVYDNRRWENRLPKSQPLGNPEAISEAAAEAVAWTGHPEVC